MNAHLQDLVDWTIESDYEQFDSSYDEESDDMQMFSVMGDETMNMDMLRDDEGSSDDDDENVG